MNSRRHTADTRRALWALLLLTLGGPLVATDARADRRIFGYTYPYMTLPQGGFEVEQYLDGDFARRDDPDSDEVEALLIPDWRYQLEFEYGITDKLDFGFYNMFRQRPYQDLTYDGIKVRSRYRLFEQGEFVVDPAFYLEAAYKNDEIALEQIVILGKVIDQVQLGLNLKFEEEWEFGVDGVSTKFEFVPSLAVGYHFSERFALSLEYLGKLEWEGAEFEHHHYAGPTLSVAGSHFWWTVTVAPEIAGVDAHPAFLARSIFAVVI